MTQSPLVVVGVNEDGFGPSALMFHLVREFIHQGRRPGGRGLRLSVRVLSTAAAAFNRALYNEDSLRGIVEVLPTRPDSLIRLEKRQGEVDVRATLRRWRDYLGARGPYVRSVAPILAGADLVIDFGVPLLVRAAEQLGIRRRLTLMDHSWAATLRLCCAEEWADVYRVHSPPGAGERRLAAEVSGWIEEDEARASEVWLFPEFLTPAPFVEHWRRLAPPVHLLPGVLGGSVERAAARRRLDAMLARSGQAPLPRDGRRRVMISPGGTPVWTHLVPEMVSRLVESPRAWLPVFSAPQAPAAEQTAQLKDRMRRSGRAWWFEFLQGSTQQAIMPAFDLVITRAGGGTVNDALATQTPFLCVEEPLVQVELIRRECVRRGLTLELPETRLSRFRQDPVAALDRLADAPIENLKAQGIPAGAESALAGRVLELLA